MSSAQTAPLELSPGQTALWPGSFLRRKQKPKHLAGAHEHLRLAKQDGLLHEHSLAELRLTIGEILHRRWFELIVVLLVSIELVMTLIEAGIDQQIICINAVYKDPRHIQCESKEGPRASVMLEHFEILGKTIVGFFSLEMFLKLLVGHFNFFKNQWLVLDLSVVLMNFAIEFVLHPVLGETVKDYGSLLMFLRYWRWLKMINLVREEKEFIDEEDEAAQQEMIRRLCRKYGIELPPELRGTGQGDKAV